MEPAAVIGLAFPQPAIEELVPEGAATDRPGTPTRVVAEALHRSRARRLERGRDLSLPQPHDQGRDLRLAAEADPRDDARAVRGMGRACERGARPGAGVRGDPRLPPGAGVPLPDRARSHRRRGPLDRATRRGQARQRRQARLRTRRHAGRGERSSRVRLPSSSQPISTRCASRSSCATSITSSGMTPKAWRLRAPRCRPRTSWAIRTSRRWPPRWPGIPLYAEGDDAISTDEALQIALAPLRDVRARRRPARHGACAAADRVDPQHGGPLRPGGHGIPTGRELCPPGRRAPAGLPDGEWVRVAGAPGHDTRTRRSCKPASSSSSRWRVTRRPRRSSSR